MKKHLFILLANTVLPLLLFAQEPFQITHGPYLQALDETSVSILWTTNRTGISWLELAPDDGTHFYRTERPKYYATDQGFKTKDTLHHIRVEGLQPGKTYRYRAFSQEVLSHDWHTVQYGRIAATQVYQKEPLRFKTADPNATSTTFAIIQDIHEKNDIMKQLLSQIDFSNNDLVIFNGDMAGFFLSQQQMFKSFMDTAIEIFASQYPMYYSRGNHETRGPFADKFRDYFPSKSGELYYLLRRGPVCFVILDSGEDKPDSDIEYSGLANFDAYRTKQAEWLKDALKQPEYVNAPYKVVICHIPPFESWHGAADIAMKFVPLLNEAKAQVMLSGHLHRNIKVHSNPESHLFPVLAVSNTTILKAKADDKELLLEIFDLEGNKLDSMSFSPQQ